VSSTDVPRHPTYDVHAHGLPEGLLDTLRADGGTHGVEVLDADEGTAIRYAGRVTTPPLPRNIGDLDHRLATMDESRVDVQLLSSWIDLTGYALPEAHAVRYSRIFNEALAATVALHPDRFVGMCTAPLQAPAAAAEELRYAITELGMVGVEIATTVDGRDLDDPALDTFWGAAAELRVPIVVHPYVSLAGRGVSRYFLNNLVGNPAESTIAIAHLIFSGVLERFPELRFVMVHGGGFAPWQAGRWDRGYRAVAKKTAEHISRPPTEYLRQVHFDTVLHDAATVGRLVDWAGVDRVVIGSDYPFPMGDLTPVDTFDAVSGLSGDERHAILHGNVQRLLDEVVR
jgi:aminocarboxymuconate-semialdehyde decarboxylase